MADPDNAAPPRNLVVWLLWAVAFGGPLAGIGAFKEWAAQHPVWAAVLTFAYWVLLFLFSLVQGIWKRLQNRILDSTAQRLDFLWQCFWGGYRKKYLGHLIHECHDIDVKGLTTQGIYALALRRVFVELEVDATPAAAVPSEAAPKLPKALATGRHHLWDYLQAGQNLAVVGGPGSGKTTLLRHVCLIVAAGHRASPQAPVIRRLPVLLYLRSCAKQIAADPHFALADAIEQGEIVKGQEEKPPAGWWAEQLVKDRCLVLFDGLDEVANAEMRAKVAEWVDKAMKRHAGNLFVTTSRPGGYRENPLSGVTILGVRPFSSRQVRAFVDNWYLANEMAARNPADPGAGQQARHEAQKGAKDLLHRLRGSITLTDLAVNPLLLTMIATVHKFRSELPGRRVELYREICEVFLGKRQQVRGVEDPAGLRPKQKQTVLEPLAFAMMRNGQREITAKEALAAIRSTLLEVDPDLKGEAFLKMVEDTSGLLVESETGVYRFAHKTFQEYLAAVHIRNQGRVAELAAKVEDEWWHETIRLYVAEADASPILQACLDRAFASVEVLVLAQECLGEAEKASPEYRTRIGALLQEGVEDPQRWRLCAEALLALRLRGLRGLDESASIDPSLVTHAEYQLMLEQRPSAELRPAHWEDEQVRFGAGQGMHPVCGVDSVQARAFCDWLTERSGGAARFRLPRSKEWEAGAEGASCGWWISEDSGIALAGVSTPASAMPLTYLARLRLRPTRCIPLSERHRG